MDSRKANPTTGTNSGGPSTRTDTRARGSRYELLAEQYLVNQGCRVLARNANYRLGELDLVVTDGSCLAFVEVRYRQHSGWGGALESVDWRKQRKLIRAAQLWLVRNPKYADSTCRFDLVTIDSNQQPNQCLWYKDAFRPE